MKKIATTLLSMGLGLGAVYAQVTNNPTAQAGANIISLVDLVQALITKIIPVLIGLTVLAFFGMMIKYMVSSDGLDKGKAWHYMMYSVVVLFVEVSIWGLVAFLASATGITQGGQVPIPEIPIGVRTYDPSKCIVNSLGQQCCQQSAGGSYICR